MTDPLVDQALSALGALGGGGAEGVWTAPGRVNLIGEHTDYTGGLSLPFALDRRAVLAVARRGDDTCRFASTAPGVAPVEVAAGDLAPGRHGWAGYLAGVVWALRERGHDVGGLDVGLASDVPVGAGLSSSAALECAMVAAICDLADVDLDGLERARVAQAAENRYVGAPTGLLDQAASTLCRAGHALACDFGEERFDNVPFDPGAAGLDVLVLDSRVPHRHVDGEYASRRASCEEAESLLGPLRLLTPADLGDVAPLLPDATMVARVRHVVTENDRVRRVVAALRAGDVAGVGEHLDASHDSLRDDYEVTVPAVDLAVDTLRDHGALGARMTGGGFGGCVIALVPTGDGQRLGRAVAQDFAEHGHESPSWFTAAPAAGAHRVL